MSVDTKNLVEFITFYIEEYYAIKEISIDSFLLFRKSEAEIAEGKELIEFKIKGKILYLNHWVGDGISQKADYALALTSHLTSILTICQMEKSQALELLNDLCKAYKAGGAIHSSAQVRNQIESMDIHGSN
jgi:hypothetical protein